MSINSSRNWFQLYIENKLGCINVEEFGKDKKYKTALTSYIIDISDIKEISDILKNDSLDFFYSWILSLFEWINGVSQSRFSWSVVKFYYSTYYFLRAFLSINWIWIIRCWWLFYIKNNNWEKFQISGTNKDSNTTHKWTINIFLNEYKKDDYYSSNEILSNNAYLWLVDLREQINYRNSRFSEPDLLNIFEKVNEYVSSNEFEDLLLKYINPKEKELYIFNENHAFISIPLNYLFDLIEHYKNKWIVDLLDKSEKDFLKTYIKNIKFLSEVEILN